MLVISDSAVSQGGLALKPTVNNFDVRQAMTL
jgi:hypothetical protein